MSSSAPLGIRANNPWNLQQAHVPWLGLVPAEEPDTGELVFDTMTDGIRAGVKLCYTYQEQGRNTPLTFITAFSPAAAGNPTAQYVTNVCGWTGFAPDQALDFHDETTMLAWARAIWRQEQGLEWATSITDDEIREGITAAVST